MPDDRKDRRKRDTGAATIPAELPRLQLSFPSGSAIKKIKVGVKALFADSSCQDSLCQPAPSPSGQVGFKRKKNTALPTSAANSSLRTLAALKRRFARGGRWLMQARVRDLPQVFRPGRFPISASVILCRSVKSNQFGKWARPKCVA